MFVGDVFGNPGVAVFQKWSTKLKEKYKLDAIIVNGENACKNGLGLTVKNADALRHSGAVAITTGNHVWEQRDFYSALDERSDVIRPANYPSGCPGKGHVIIDVAGHSVAIVNLVGRVFMRDFVDCPLRTMESLLTFLRTKTKLIFIDFHAEATSEKRLLGFFLDGKVSAVLGTHTHIQTADEQVLPKGTAYLTDVGSCGALNSILGMQYEGALRKAMYQNKMGKFAVELNGPIVFNGVCVSVDTETGLAVDIERIRFVDEELAATLPPESNSK